MRLTVRGRDDVLGGQEGDGGAGGYVAVLGGGDEAGECLGGTRDALVVLLTAMWGTDIGLAYLNWESRVARRAGTGHDERGRERVDLVERQGHVERTRERAFAERGADVRRVAGFDRQDRARSREICRAHDVGRGAQVRAHADALEDGRGRDKAHGVRDAEVVAAGGDGGGAGLCEGGGQEGHVGHFVRGDFFEVGVEGAGEAGGCEGGFGEVGEAFAVEGVFEVLEGEGVVEDVGVGDGGGGLADLL